MNTAERIIQDLEGIRRNYSSLAPSENPEKDKYALRLEKTRSCLILGYSRPSFEEIPEESLGNCIYTILTGSPTFKSLEVAMKKFDELGEKGFNILSQAMFQIQSCQRKIERNSPLDEQETLKKLVVVTIATFQQFLAPLQNSQTFTVNLSNKHDELSRLHRLVVAKSSHYDRIISLFLTCSSYLIYCKKYFNDSPSLFISAIKEVLPIESLLMESVEKKIGRSRRSFRGVSKNYNAIPPKWAWQQGQAKPRLGTIRVLTPYISEDNANISDKQISPILANNSGAEGLDPSARKTFAEVGRSCGRFFYNYITLQPAQLPSQSENSEQNVGKSQVSSSDDTVLSKKKRIANQAIKEFIKTVKTFAKKMAAYQRELEAGLIMAINSPPFNEATPTERPRSVSCEEKFVGDDRRKAENILLADQMMLSDCICLSEIAAVVANNCRHWDIGNDLSIEAIEQAITTLYMVFYKGPEASPTAEMQLLAMLQMACLSSKKNESLYAAIYDGNRFALSKECCWQFLATQTFTRLRLPLEGRLAKAIKKIPVHSVIKDRLQALIQHLAFLSEMSNLFL